MEMLLAKSRPEGDVTNRFEGRVVHRVFLGELVKYAVQVRELRWRVQAHFSQRFAPGDPVWVSFSQMAATMVLAA
jgi:hypothetical protein